ncbi:MAG: phytoene/squalene synthase family protein [Myxococcota bacterium]
MADGSPEAWRTCRRVLAESSQSFDWASRTLPRRQRDEIAALYAWCRRCDDAIDLAPPERHHAILADMRARLEAVHRGTPPDDEVEACLQIVMTRRRIPLDYPRALLDGMQMDVDAAAYASFDDLLVYCWCVAGTVGLMMCHVLGLSDPRATRHAAHLGIAMQLTNIARDVSEDWHRGRVYLPRELLAPRLLAWLDAHATPHARPTLPAELWPEVAVATRELLLHAERYYASADRGLEALAPRAALAIRAARLIYAEIGREVERRGPAGVPGRAIVPRRRKLALLGRALVAFARAPRPGAGRRVLIPDGVLDAGEAVSLR